MRRILKILLVLGILIIPVQAPAGPCHDLHEDIIDHGCLQCLRHDGCCIEGEVRWQQISKITEARKYAERIFERSFKARKGTRDEYHIHPKRAEKVARSRPRYKLVDIDFVVLVLIGAKPIIQVQDKKIVYKRNPDDTSPAFSGSEELVIVQDPVFEYFTIKDRRTETKYYGLDGKKLPYMRDKNKFARESHFIYDRATRTAPVYGLKKPRRIRKRPVR